MEDNFDSKPIQTEIKQEIQCKESEPELEQKQEQKQQKQKVEFDEKEHELQDQRAQAIDQEYRELYKAQVVNMLLELRDKQQAANTFKKTVPHLNPHNVDYNIVRGSYNPKDMERAAECTETLVPIRLDLAHESIKIRDSFTFNLHNNVVHPDVFANLLLRDFGIPRPAKALVTALKSSLSTQIKDFTPLEPNEEDRRIILKLDITIGDVWFVDTLEWDLSGDPEMFAENVVRELNLIPEFKTAIAHSIREQVSLLTRTGGDFLPTLSGPFIKRTFAQIDQFGPYLSTATANDIEKLTKTLERESRRKRRTRNRAVEPDAIETRSSRTQIPNSLLFIVKDPTAPKEVKCERCIFNVSKDNKKLCQACSKDDEFDDTDEDTYKPG